MSDAAYLIMRAHQELNAAIASSDDRVRQVHLEMADAYAFRLREIQRIDRRAEQLMFPDPAAHPGVPAAAA